MFEDISEIDWARLAAYVDGEGCISISRRLKKFQMSVRVCNTNPKLMVWLKQFGGHVLQQQQNKKWKLSYAWQLGQRQAVPILLKILPYLILKREQAEVALAFTDTIMPFARSGDMRDHPEKYVWLRSVRSMLHERMRDLNGKGVPIQ